MQGRGAVIWWCTGPPVPFSPPQHLFRFAPAAFVRKWPLYPPSGFMLGTTMIWAPISAALPGQHRVGTGQDRVRTGSASGQQGFIGHDDDLCPTPAAALPAVFPVQFSSLYSKFSSVWCVGVPRSIYLMDKVSHGHANEWVKFIFARWNNITIHNTWNNESSHQKKSHQKISSKNQSCFACTHGQKKRRKNKTWNQNTNGNTTWARNPVWSGGYKISFRYVFQAGILLLN